MRWDGWGTASHGGFVALAPNHHGNTAVEPYRPEGFLCWWERARDLSVLLDGMIVDDRFAACLDASRAFIAGFSLGAHTALSLLGGVTDMERFRDWAGDGRLGRGPREFPDLSDHFAGLMAGSAVFRQSWDRQAAAYRDDRIRAGLLLAPAPPVRAFTEASLAGITAPVRVVTSGTDAEAPVQAGPIWLRERMSRCTLDIVSPDAGHFVFLPEATETGRIQAPDLCLDPPGVDRRAIHDAVADAAERLFA